MSEVELGERVSSLETAVSTLHADIADVKGTMSAGFRELNKTLSDANKTNWSVILSGVMVALALYAAAIRPLSQDVGRLEEIVTRQGQLLTEVRVAQATSTGKIESLGIDLKTVIDRGSPITDRRLSVLEQRDRERRP